MVFFAIVSCPLAAAAAEYSTSIPVPSIDFASELSFDANDDFISINGLLLEGDLVAAPDKKPEAVKVADAILAATSPAPVLPGSPDPEVSANPGATSDAEDTVLAASTLTEDPGWFSEFVSTWVSLPLVLETTGGIGLNEQVVGQVVGFSLLRLDTNSKRYKVSLEAGMPLIHTRTGAELDSSLAFRLGWNRKF